MPADTHATPPLPGLSPVAGKPIIARFDGGALSSDGGLLALREIEERLGIARRLAACIDDPRAPDRIQHSLADMLRFRLLMIAAGYEDGNDAGSLRHDPLFKLASGRLPDAAALCSQPTLPCLENTPGRRELVRMARTMVALYCASFRQVPRRITLDIDDTFDTVHGGQQLRLFNAYCDEYGFQPIVVFDADGRPVAAMLRPARRPTGAEARAFLRRLVVETDGTARGIYENIYCRRGQAENHIKAWKRHLTADRTSCCRAAANQFRLMLHTGAYWLLWSLCSLMPKRSTWRVAQFDTLRLRLVKLATRVVALKTRVMLHLPSACPDKAILRLALERLPRLAC
ncbi:MAG: transposase [Roseomonas sp.]|nr:transposase [Roseomonas sp.]